MILNNNESVDKSKHILITGGSRGIGAEAVSEFSAYGSSVAFLYRRSYKEALEMSRRTGALSIKCNVANPESVHAAMQVVNDYFEDRIDVLICNAGISDFGLVTDIGVSRWKEVIDTNLNSAYYCINEVLPSMIRRKKGNIILVSSMWGQVGASCEVAYSTAKAGLIGLTKSLAKEVGPSGIRVNCIAPGMIDTDMNHNVDAETKKAIVEETPLERMGTPKDIAKTMLFLASEQSSFITGQVLGVNGGLII